MPRSKKANGRSNARNRSNRASNVQSSFVPSSDPDAYLTPVSRAPRNVNGVNGTPPPYSLQDEALNTERHHGWTASGTSLRHQKMSFVSAGEFHSDPFEDIQKSAGEGQQIESSPDDEPSAAAESAFASMTLNTASTEMNVEVHTSEGAPMALESTAGLIIGSSEHLELMGTSLDNEEPFFVDTIGQAPINKPHFPHPTIDSPPCPDSDSSEEVILFAGRNASGRGHASHTKPQPPQSTSTDTNHLSNNNPSIKIAHSNGFHQPISPRRDTSPNLALDRGIYGDLPAGEFTLATSDLEDGMPSHGAESFQRPSKRQRRRDRTARKRQSKRSRIADIKDAEAAILADYIANMAKSDNDADEQASVEAKVLPSEILSEALSTPQTKGDSNTKAQRRTGGLSGWSEGELHDLDSLSTSGEVLGLVQDILSKRERPGGIQYLVVWEGYTVDDARWVPASTLMSADAEESVRKFEEDERLVTEYPASDSDSDSSDDDFAGEKIGDEMPEGEFWNESHSRLADEDIARLLAKQEDLGMGSRELLLLDDTPSANTEDNIMLNDESPGKLRRSTRLRTRREAGIPSASLVADVYDDVVMDWERPSLHKKPKTSKETFPSGLISDSELEATLHAAWLHDREKKGAKKREREELRAEGLLGRRGSQRANLQQKYSEGMTLDDVKEEIKDFLVTDHTTLSLPPMEKRDRVVVHEIANHFKLKSKSVGNGLTRFPTLYKTSRTGTYDEDSLDMLDRKMNHRKFLPRLDRKTRQENALKARLTQKNTRAMEKSAVSYRDGEVVGAAAPELGVENRGRAMLERMGWSTGTALGAMDNKGILQPVSHVVKISKAGLG
ncbi:MAG: hypothetical protein M1833_004685 [Piccolia ochrophora]|nr:MAG: hypothetical protein M1833_004685 [Piccolia ochrophora]